MTVSVSVRRSGRLPVGVVSRMDMAAEHTHERLERGVDTAGRVVHPTVPGSVAHLRIQGRSRRVADRARHFSGGLHGYEMPPVVACRDLGGRSPVSVSTCQRFEVEMTTTNSQQKNFHRIAFRFWIHLVRDVAISEGHLCDLCRSHLARRSLLPIGGLSTGNALTIIGAIIFAPLVTLVYLVFTRIIFEVIAMFFRIGDNTFLAVQLLGGRAGQWAQGPQPGYGPPAPYGSQPVPNAPWGYSQVRSDTAGAPTGAPYGCAAADLRQPQRITDSRRATMASRSPTTGSRRTARAASTPKSSETPPTEPGQQGWGPGQTPPTQ